MIDRQQFLDAGVSEAQPTSCCKLQQDIAGRVPYTTAEQARTDRLRQESTRSYDEGSQRWRDQFADLNARLDKLGAPRPTSDAS